MSVDMLTAKIEFGFAQLTARSGGVLDGPSHVAMGRRAAAAIGYTLGSEEEARMIEAYLNVWRLMHLPHLPAGSRGLTRDEFVRSNLALADGSPADREAILGALADTFFCLADVDGDGKVDREEFWAFQHGHFPELTRAVLAEAFDHLDTDRDGYLSRQQFTTSIVEYWTSRDPNAPGNWWLGRPTYLNAGPSAKESSAKESSGEQSRAEESSDHSGVRDRRSYPTPLDAPVTS